MKKLCIFLLTAGISQCTMAMHEKILVKSGAWGCMGATALCAYKTWDSFKKEYAEAQKKQTPEINKIIKEGDKILQAEERVHEAAEKVKDFIEHKHHSAIPSSTEQTIDTSLTTANKILKYVQLYKTYHKTVRYGTLTAASLLTSIYLLGKSSCQPCDEELL